jgi:hypothetical protein
MTDTPKTIDISPTRRLQTQAFETFGVPLGGALNVDADGHLSFDADAADVPDVLGALTGQILSDHAIATMVLPSNVQGLRGSPNSCASRRPSRADRSGRRADRRGHRRLDGIIGNLDGLMVR